MSTRATYQFRAEHGYQTTLYIHYDGYLSGAASYFAAACRHPNKRGTLADRMLRANDVAEITMGHDAHGDTEFRYTVLRPVTSANGPDVLRAQSRTWNDASPWRTVFEGSIAEFLNAHAGEGDVWRMLGRECVHVDELTERAQNAITSARNCLANGWTGNASGCAGDVARLISAGAKIDSETFRAFLAEVCKTFPHMVDYHLQEAGLVGGART